MEKIISIYALIFLISGFGVIQAQHSHQNHNAMDTKEVSSEHSVYHTQAEWTNHRNETFLLHELKGKPVIVTMFYGNCTQVCPILIRDANRVFTAVDSSLRNDVQVLAITFDTKNDTPEILKAYANKKELNIPQWHFVTGPDAAIRELAMMLGVQYSKKSDGHFAHSNLVTVLDSKGRIVHRLEGLNQPVDEAAHWIENHILKTKNENLSHKHHK
ncbi:MAG TPA: SCO family protein [Balneolaceae bacterium]|nr:SCO family protein [Balneolaceae bacterium]